MGTETATTSGLLARAAAERAAGRGEEAARLYDLAVLSARADGDLEVWAAAALGAASVQVFGAEPGRIPGQLYDVLARTTDHALRARLAAALARCWVYAGEASRAGQFSQEAVDLARGVGDPALMADALDAALAAHWGPDDLAARRELARELDDVTAHVLDPDARLQSHLWGLQIACETLDLPAMNRQIRALERLGEESPRALFFAATRRAMLDLLRGRPDTCGRLLEIAGAAAEEEFIADAWMVTSCVSAYAAIQEGRLDTAAEMAASAEGFALGEGIPTVLAEAAFLWVGGGEPDRARAALSTLDGDLEDLPRNVDWLLRMQLMLDVALATDETAMIARLADLLTPYAGRAVVNAGAVMFHGTTDDTLSRAYARLGRDEESAALRARALAAYERIGAQWWRRRLEESSDVGRIAEAGAPGRVHLHPSGPGLWQIGREAVPLAGLRGFGYLRDLVRRPGESLAALELVGARGPVVAETGLGEVLDRQALAAYRGRLAELETELAQAEDWADAGRVEAARAERDALLDEIARATGLGGRTRVSGSSQERARSAVKKAISTAIERIAAADDALAAHLRNSIKTGLLCSYEPEPGTAPDWVLDTPDQGMA